MEKCRTRPLECKDMQVSSFMELFPTLLSHGIDQCDVSYLNAIKFSSCCLQCLLCLTPKCWSSLLSSAHISPCNSYALLNKHHTHSISQPAPLRLSLFTWNFAFFSKCFNYNSLFLFSSICSCPHALTKFWLNNPKNTSWRVSPILKPKDNISL